MFSHRSLGSFPLVSTFLLGTVTFMETQGCLNGGSPAGLEEEREAKNCCPSGGASEKPSGTPETSSEHLGRVVLRHRKEKSFVQNIRRNL